MRDTTTTPCLLFPDLCDRPLTAVFDLPNASSDGSAVLLKAADRRLSLVSRLAAALVDERQASKVRHGLADLLGQRIYGLALGYADANDAARLADDPVHKLLLGRDPVRGAALASQPMRSGFENDATTRGRPQAELSAIRGPARGNPVVGQQVLRTHFDSEAAAEIRAGDGDACGRVRGTGLGQNAAGGLTGAIGCPHRPGEHGPRSGMGRLRATKRGSGSGDDNKGRDTGESGAGG